MKCYNSSTYAIVTSVLDPDPVRAIMACQITVNKDLLELNFYSRFGLDEEAFLNTQFTSLGVAMKLHARHKGRRRGN